jgi:hypothetical protein
MPGAVGAKDEEQVLSGQGEYLPAAQRQRL